MREKTDYESSREDKRVLGGIDNGTIVVSLHFDRPLGLG